MEFIIETNDDIKSFDESGACFRQAIIIDSETANKLIDIVQAEIDSGYPRHEEYGYTYNISPLRITGDKIFLKLTEMKFLNIFLKTDYDSSLNTYLLIK